MRTLHRRFDTHYIRKIYGGEFTKFCGLLRIYELYISSVFFHSTVARCALVAAALAGTYECSLAWYTCSMFSRDGGRIENLEGLMVIMWRGIICHPWLR